MKLTDACSPDVAVTQHNDLPKPLRWRELYSHYFESWCGLTNVKPRMTTVAQNGYGNLRPEPH